MKRIMIIVSALLMTVITGVVACNSESKTSEKTEGLNEPVALSQDSLIHRGQYLVTIMGCNDCHSPKKMGPRGPELDSSLLFSGHPAKMPVAKIDQASLKDWVLFNQHATAMVGPWGISFAANISSDESGIGNWTEQQFFTAIRKGKYKGLENGRTLLPPMPWQMYALATDEDLKAIFAFLKSTQPVPNVVPSPIPPDQLASRFQ